MNNGKICVSVCAEKADEMIAKIKQAEEFADVIEVRFDCLPESEIDKVFEQLPLTDKTYLMTYRPDDQGGRRPITMDERVDFWFRTLLKIEKHKFLIDHEFDTDFRMHLIASIIIVSFHDFSDISRDLDADYDLLSRLSRKKPLKFAVKANDITDGIAVWKLLAIAKSEKKQFIPIAMSDAGKWTRILGLAHGAFMTYASLETGDETAPGQVTARDMVEVYRVKELDENTQVFGVIGDPIAQSLSPYMHNPAFAELGMNSVFIPLLVKNIDEFMRRMVRRETREVELNFGGFSVTMPHKQSIMLHLDAIDPTAKAIGAVNTVKIIDGKLTGYNTDAHGFIIPLKENYGDVKNARVAVFGAGGAARACVYALKLEGADVTVFARDPTKGKAFAVEFGVRSSESSDLSDGFDILVDTTPLGMKGLQENESLFTADELSGVKFVFDLVTKLTDTPLVAEAKKAGIPAIGGLEMLIAQGEKQFEIWTGKAAPAGLMRNSLIARLPK